MFREFGFVPGKLFGRLADFLDPERLGFQEVLGHAQPPAPRPAPRSGGQSGCRSTALRSGLPWGWGRSSGSFCRQVSQR